MGRNNQNSSFMSSDDSFIPEGDDSFIPEDDYSVRTESVATTQATRGGLEVDTAVADDNNNNHRRPAYHSAAPKASLRPKRRLWILFVPLFFFVITLSLYFYWKYDGEWPIKLNSSENDSQSADVLNATDMPSVSPYPSEYPTDWPTPTPSVLPSDTPSEEPSEIPSSSHSTTPSASPTALPTSKPTTSSSPSASPTSSPTDVPTPSPTDAFIDFYVMGDYPYANREKKKLPQHLEDIPGDAPFVYHLGDMNKASDTNCTEDAYQEVHDLLRTSVPPVFITPGEEDWNACPSPPDAWNLWHKYFFRFDKKWNHTLQTHHQQTRGENVAFFHKFALFIGVNLPARADDDVVVRQDSPLDRGTWKQLMNDNFDWVVSQMYAHKDVMSAVIVFGHAGPSLHNGNFFGPLVEAAHYFAVPVLYVHGHGHEFETKTSLYGSDYVSTLQIDRGGKGPPLMIRVRDGGGSRRPFQYDRRVNKREQNLEDLTDEFLTIGQVKAGLTLEQVEAGYTVEYVDAGISFEEFLNGKTLPPVVEPEEEEEEVIINQADQPDDADAVTSNTTLGILSP